MQVARKDSLLHLFELASLSGHLSYNTIVSLEAGACIVASHPQVPQG